MATKASGQHSPTTRDPIQTSSEVLEGTLVGHLQTAIERHKAGELDPAEDSYKKVLEFHPDHPHALHLLGVVRHQRGDNESAVELIERAVALNPRFGEAYCNLGAAYHAMGRLAQAEVNFRRATELDPASAEAHSNLATTLNELGNSKAAIEEFGRAHAANPRETKFIKRLGDLYLELDHHEDAAERFENFLELRPDDAEVQNNLGYAYERLLRLEDSLEHYLAAAQLSPDTPEILNNAACILNRLDRADEAAIYFKRALEIRPDNWADLSNLADAYVNRDDSVRAFPIYQQLIAANPDDPKLYNNYGIALAKSGRTLDAVGQLEKAIALDPDYADAYNNLGSTKVAIPDRPGAIVSFKKAIEARPRYVAAHVNITTALLQEYRYDEAYFYAKATLLLDGFHIKMFTNPHKALRSVCDFDAVEELGDLFENLEQNPVSQYTASFLEMLVLADSDEKIVRLVGYNAQWGEDLSRRFNANPLPPLEPRKIAGKIRLGFMSADLRTHSVTKFVLPLFQELDKDRFVINCYVPYEDEADPVQAEIKQLADEFKNVQGRSDFQIAELIRDDAVDILFEMNGFTRDGRMKVMTLRPAPIQIEWLGYPFTTGVAEIDYLLLDPDIVPENPDWLVEQPLVMPESWVAFGELHPEPISESNPFERNGRITFGTMNNPYKFTRETIADWGRIMEQVPGSRFLIVRPECGSMSFCSNFAKEMKRNGIGADRLNFVNNRPLPLRHFAYYDEIDISLDTFPVTGGNTTCDSLWMGVPVVSLYGPSLQMRVSASLLKKLGLEALCTRSRDDYVKIAVELAHDRERLRELRLSLRPMLQNSCLGDTERWARNFENLMEQLVEKHGLA